MPLTRTRWFNQCIQAFPHSKKCRWLLSATSRIYKKYWERRDSNPGLLGEKCERYLCAMLPFCLRIFCAGNLSRLLYNHLVIFQYRRKASRAELKLTNLLHRLIFCTMLIASWGESNLLSPDYEACTTSLSCSRGTILEWPTRSNCIIKVSSYVHLE